MARTIFLALLTVLLAAPAIATDAGPAVSDPNGKLSVEGGHYDDEQSFLARGSYSIPLGHSFGLQADGALGRVDEDTMGGAGLHLFTRDPSSYLLGLYGSYHTWDSIDIWRTAVEFQLYVHQFSIEGLGGYESVNGPLTSNGFFAVNTDDKHGFGLIDLAYYPIDDLKLYVGYHYEDATSLGSAGVEYLLRTSGSPISLFAKSDFGDSQLNRVTGGLKVYFSADPGKSLIERHRTEDPENYTPKFPLRATGSNQCTVNSSFVVTSPTNGQCICPPGTFQAGNPPSSFNGNYVCFNPL
jgi:opacity protein-like surface antigen